MPAEAGRRDEIGSEAYTPASGGGYRQVGEAVCDTNFKRSATDHSSYERPAEAESGLSISYRSASGSIAWREAAGRGVNDMLASVDDAIAMQ